MLRVRMRKDKSQSALRSPALLTSLLWFFEIIVESEEDHSHGNWIFIQSLLQSKGISHHHIHLAETQWQAEWEHHIVETRKASGVLWLETAGIRKIRWVNQKQGILWDWLVLSWRQRQKLGTFSVINQVLTALDYLAQRLCVRVLLSDMVWPSLSIDICHLSLLKIYRLMKKKHKLVKG